MGLQPVLETCQRKNKGLYCRHCNQIIVGSFDFFGILVHDVHVQVSKAVFYGP